MSMRRPSELHMEQRKASPKSGTIRRTRRRSTKGFMTMLSIHLIRTTRPLKIIALVSIKVFQEHWILKTFCRNPSESRKVISHLKMGMRGSIGFDSDGKPLVYINVDPRIGLVDIDVVSSTIFSFRNPVQSEDQNKRFGNLGYNESTCLTLSHHELWALSLEECLQDLTQSSTAQRTQVFQIDEKDWVRPVFWRTSKTVEPLQVDDSQA
ncbi:hypothetical protein VNI00_017967 [Paramarasmius palmivorus]|uniref:Uncharacterized protein n=1 Tax=Paramarasmius palmivorus TaxID=297713 RepID=A0AAW0B258_9AGAR